MQTKKKAIGIIAIAVICLAIGLIYGYMVSKSKEVLDDSSLVTVGTYEWPDKIVNLKAEVDEYGRTGILWFVEQNATGNGYSTPTAKKIINCHRINGERMEFNTSGEIKASKTMLDYPDNTFESESKLYKCKKTYAEQYCASLKQEGYNLAYKEQTEDSVDMLFERESERLRIFVIKNLGNDKVYCTIGTCEDYKIKSEDEVRRYWESKL